MLLLEQRFYCSGFFWFAKASWRSHSGPYADLARQSQSGKDAQENAGLKVRKYMLMIRNIISSVKQCTKKPELFCSGLAYLVTLLGLFIKTFLAINGAVALRLERNLCFNSTAIAYHIVHLALKAIVAFVRSTGGASARFVLKAFFGVELLL